MQYWKECPECYGLGDDEVERERPKALRCHIADQLERHGAPKWVWERLHDRTYYYVNMERFWTCRRQGCGRRRER